MVAMKHTSGAAFAVGRFAGCEPLGFEAGDNNSYRFVSNKPTGKTDPSGLKQEGLFLVELATLTAAAPGAPLLATTSGRIAWAPPAAWDAGCPCNLVGLFQIAFTIEVKMDMLFLFSTTFRNPWHLDDGVRKGKATTFDYVHHGAPALPPKGGVGVDPDSAVLRDDPGLHSDYWLKRLLTLEQRFETGAVCLDPKSGRYLEVFGTVLWSSRYVRRGTSDPLDAQLTVDTADGAHTAASKAPGRSALMRTNSERGLPPSKDFVTIVSGAAGGAVSW